VVEGYLNKVRVANGIELGKLKEMIDEMNKLKADSKIILYGFNDYTKHLINLFGESREIIAIVDNDEKKIGWSYRSTPVVSFEEAMEKNRNRWVCTAIDERFEILGKITNHKSYKNEEISYFPKRGTYNPWEHSSFYKKLREEKHKAPGSMMKEDKILFLLELLKQSLYIDGDVLEAGVWQGGSAWFIAKILEKEAPEKKLVLVDFFEAMSRNNPEGVMCLDEMKGTFEFYKKTIIHQGNVDENPEFLKGKFCFIHYDMGFNEKRLSICYESLCVGGIMLFDNYGHIAGKPYKFDQWFKDRGHQVAMAPHSEQGWLIKHG